MKVSFPCNVCGFGTLEIEDMIDSGTTLKCIKCQTDYVLDIFTIEQRRDFYKAAERGSYVQEKKQIQHTCPECGFNFKA